VSVVFIISDLCLINWLSGLQRCGKSCRLRWINYLRPDIRRGRFTPEEEKLIISLHGVVGNRFELHYIALCYTQNFESSSSLQSFSCFIFLHFLPYCHNTHAFFSVLYTTSLAVVELSLIALY